MIKIGGLRLSGRCLHIHWGVWPWYTAAAHTFWFDNTFKVWTVPTDSGHVFGIRVRPVTNICRPTPAEVYFNCKVNLSSDEKHLILILLLRVWGIVLKLPFWGSQCWASAARCGCCFWCNPCVALLQQGEMNGEVCEALFRCCTQIQLIQPKSNTLPVWNIST